MSETLLSCDEVCIFAHVNKIEQKDIVSITQVVETKGQLTFTIFYFA